MRVAFSGHRPKKLGGYGSGDNSRVLRFARHVVQRLKAAHGIEHAVVGMAMGWDMAVAFACVHEKVPFTAAIPFEGQDSVWFEKTRADYQWLLARAAEKVVVCEGGYEVWKMQKRNEWMVDHSEMLVALFDGTSGGTANCVQYAREQSRTIMNVWPKWLAFER